MSDLKIHTPLSTDSVFIIGCPRSGSSAFAWAMDKHPDFWTSAESNFLSLFFKDQWLKNQHKFGQTRGERHWLSKNKVSYEEYAYYIGLGIDLLYQNRSANKRWVEQTPEYTIQALDIAIMFPSAKFIHLIRDGRNVVHSMVNSGFPVAWATDFTLACKTWVKFVETGLEAQRNHPSRVLEVRHENLVSDPSSEFEKILKFLNASIDPSPSEYLKNNKVNSSFKGDKKTTWRDWDKNKLKSFMKIAGETLRQLGYETD